MKYAGKSLYQLESHGFGARYERQFLRDNSDLLEVAGVFINRSFQYVCSRPDAVIRTKNYVVPVEVKTVHRLYSEEERNKVIAENYHQLQIQMFTMNSEILFLHVFFVKSKRSIDTVLRRDPNYAGFYLPRLEKTFFRFFFRSKFSKFTDVAYRKALCELKLVKNYKGEIFDKLDKKLFAKTVVAHTVAGGISEFCAKVLGEVPLKQLCTKISQRLTGSNEAASQKASNRKTKILPHDYPMKEEKAPPKSVIYVIEGLSIGNICKKPPARKRR